MCLNTFQYLNVSKVGYGIQIAERRYSNFLLSSGCRQLLLLYMPIFDVCRHASSQEVMTERVGLQELTSSVLQALADADAIDAKAAAGINVRPLCGLPLAVKDSTDVLGLPTSGGTPGLVGAILSNLQPCSMCLPVANCTASKY